MSYLDEKYCLEWKDFQTITSKSFGKLREDKVLFDVTLVSDDNVHVEAHKVVLSASSEFFRNVLIKAKHNHPMIYLNGIKSSELSNILDYVYNGCVNINQSCLERFIEVATTLNISGLQMTDQLHDEHEHAAHPVPQIERRSTPIKTNFKSIKEYSKFLSQEAKPKVEKNDVKEASISEEMFMATETKTTSKINKLGSATDYAELQINLADLCDGKSMKCKNCGQTSRDLSDLKRHIERHFHIALDCKMCGKILSTSRDFRKHVTDFH